MTNWENVARLNGYVADYEEGAGWYYYKGATEASGFFETKYECYKACCFDNNLIVEK